MLKNTNRSLGIKHYRAGQKYDTPLFKLTIYKGEEKDRFWFIVPKKVDKRAVVRNKTRRVYKKIINEILPDFKQKQSMIFFIKSKADFKQTEKIQKLMTQVFKKENLLK